MSFLAHLTGNFHNFLTTFKFCKFSKNCCNFNILKKSWYFEEEKKHGILAQLKKKKGLLLKSPLPPLPLPSHQFACRFWDYFHIFKTDFEKFVEIHGIFQGCRGEKFLEKCRDCGYFAKCQKTKKLHFFNFLVF